MYKSKYLKYKKKYMDMKKIIGGDKKLTFIQKYLDLGENNINYITFLLYNENPEISTYLDSNYYEQKESNDYKILNGGVNGFLIEMDSSVNLPELNIIEKKYNTLVKFCNNYESDNLFFEFLNGTCINKLKKKSPNWIKTYSFIKTPLEMFKLRQHNSKVIHIPEPFMPFSQKTVINYNDEKKLNRENFIHSCDNIEKFYAGIFMEKIENSRSSHTLIIDIIKILEDIYITQNISPGEEDDACTPEQSELIMDLFGTLIQVYTALNLADEKINHNDMNLNNVLLMKDPTSKIITFNYNYFNPEYDYGDNNQIKIYSNYIAIIMDYGKSYVNCDDINSTYSFINKACDIPQCRSNSMPLINEKMKCKTIYGIPRSSWWYKFKYFFTIKK